MKSSNKSIEKAEIALDILLKHDEKNSNCNFKEVLEEIISAWRKHNN